jgi:hypothetical protein
VKGMLVLAAAFTGVAWLHLTSTAVLVSAGPVMDRGEGGPAFDCTYLGTSGFLLVSHFYAAEPDKDVRVPRARSRCDLICTATLGPRYQGSQLARCS